MEQGKPQRRPAPPDGDRLPRPRQVWGVDDASVLATLQGMSVEVHLTTAKVLIGQLVGYGQYTLTLKTPVRVVVINKGAIVWYAEYTGETKA